MNYARTFENGSFPPIHLSITMLRPALITRVPHRGVPKGTPSPIGNHPGPCYGFTENVHISSLSDLFATNFSWVDSWLWEEYSQVCFPSVARNSHRTNMIDKLRDHPGHQIHIRSWVGFLGLLLLRLQRYHKAEFPCFVIIPSCPTLRPIRHIMRRTFLIILCTQTRIGTTFRRFACAVPQGYAHDGGTNADLFHHRCSRRVSQ